MELVITPTGLAHCVYGEAINLTSIGRIEIRRASHVEPDAQGRWHADLSPVSGPMLGPFEHRSEALAAEREWLQAHWLAS